MTQANHNLIFEIASREKAQRELEAAQGQLMEASRQAGMAELATSVLHNVGNVLNSVNVSSSLVSDKVRGSKVASLAKAVKLMESHAQDLPGFFGSHPKGKLLAKFLSDLSQHLASEQKIVLDELASLRANIEHIKDIVTLQQGYAKGGGRTEKVSAGELIEDALRMSGASLARQRIRVLRECDPGLPTLAIDKQRVLQVLVNLIRNAQHACDESSQSDKRLVVRVAGAHGRINLSVIDNGVGVTSDNLKRLFTRGFTTRKTGHGFGLHSCSVAAQEMGGRLLAHSDGPGKGATFTLELPLQ